MAEDSVAALRAAAGGDQAAWNELVERYTPLVVSVIRRYRLGAEDSADVNQTVWLRLVENLDRIRELRALPKWIITTTRHECLHVLRSGRRTTATDPQVTAELAEDPSAADIDEGLLRAERHQALRDGFALLGPGCRDLLGLLLRDPPASYAEISVELDMPRGSIGPTRNRCLDKLRGSPPVASFLAATGDGDGRGGGFRDVATVG